MRSVIFIEFAAIIGMYSAPNLLRPQSGPGLILVLPSRCIQQVQRGELSKHGGIVLTIKYSKKYSFLIQKGTINIKKRR